MSIPKNSHQFVVNLDGLNLNEKQLFRVNQAIQKAVISELAAIDLPVKKGGLLASMGNGGGTQGVEYIANIKNLQIK